MSDDIIDEVTDYLRYRTECGERTVELEPETIAALRATRNTGAEGASRAAGVAAPSARELLSRTEIASKRRKSGLYAATQLFGNV